MNQQVEDYIKKMRDLGISDDVTKSELIKVGWPKEEVDSVMSNLINMDIKSPKLINNENLNQHDEQVDKNFVMKKTNIPETKEQTQTSTSGLKRTLIVLFLILVLGGIGFSAYAFVWPMIADKFFSKAPYNKETFFADLFNNLTKINSTSYNLSISALAEPRNLDFKSLRESFPEYAPTDSTLNLSMPMAPSEIIDEPLLTQLIRSEDFYAKSLPKDLNGSIKISGSLNLNKTDGFKSDSRFGLGLNYQTADLSLVADVEFLSDNGLVFGRVNNFPPFLFFNFEKIKGQWVKLIDEQDLENEISKQFSDNQEYESTKTAWLSILRKLPKMIDETGVLYVNDKPIKTEYKDQKVYRYDMNLNPNKMSDFLDKFSAEIRDTVPEEDLNNFDQVFNEYKKVWTDPSFVQLLNYTNKSSGLSILISEEDKMPVSISVSNYIFVGSSTNPEAFQVKIMFNLDFSDINKSIDVQAPSEFITLEEAQNLMMGDQNFEMLKTIPPPTGLNKIENNEPIILPDIPNKPRVVPETP